MMTRAAKTGPIELIKTTTKQGYDKRSWQAEAARHLESAKLLRIIRKRRRARVGKASEASRLRHVQAMDAAVTSSNLLVGYAIELFLKAGATSLYQGCSKGLFQNEIKRRYGHDLVKLAKAIELPMSSTDRSVLKWMTKVILHEGRYPPLAQKGQSYNSLRNYRAFKFWSDQEFATVLELVDRIRDHVSLIDGDSNNPASYIAYRISGDGYFAFRCGGNLKARITVKYSSAQRRMRKNSKRELKRLILRHTQNPLVGRYWDSAEYRVVKT